MKKSSPAVVLGLLVGLLAACGPSSPSTPSPAAQTPPTTTLGPPQGRVELTTNRADGAMLVVNPCPGEGNTIPCTGDLQMTFSVVLNRDIDRARVWTEFYTTTGRVCGGASTAFVSLTAGIPATLTASFVYLSFQGAATAQCGLPVQTTRMVAHLYDWASPNDVLTQEFSKAYTFTIP